MTAPSIGVDLLVFVRERRLKGTAMQVQFDDIAGRKRLLWQIGEEEFVDNSRPRDTHRTLLFTRRMGGHHHPAERSFGPHRYLGAIVKTALHQAFGPLLELIGREVQPRLNQRVIEQVIVFAAGYKREPSHIGEDYPIPILPIEAQQCAFLWKAMGRQIPANG